MSTVIPYLRLLNQRIVESSLPAPADAARALLAMQGQDFPGAKWSIALRTRGGTERAVDAAFASGAIVRSWPLRGTLHVVAAEDLHWLLSLTSARVLARSVPRREALGLDAATLKRARTLSLRALEGEAPVTRRALLAAFAKGGVSPAGQRGYHILFYLGLHEVLCFGPTAGKEPTFVRVDAWIGAHGRPKSRRLEGDEALGELARRYFLGHGPATVKDLTAWAKLTAAQTKTAMAVAAPHLEALHHDGVAYWLGTEAAERQGEAAAMAKSVCLLPGFDEYLLGYQSRGLVLPAKHAPRIVPGGNGMFMPTLVVNGQVVGTWRRKVMAREVLLEPLLFTKLPAAPVRGIEAAARAYGDYLEAPVRVAKAVVG